MIEIQVGRRTFPIRFDLGAWMEVDERFGSLEQMEADKTVKARIACLAIFARAGARYHGGEAPTEEYLTQHLGPKGLVQANRQASRAFVAGMKREMAEDDDEDIDVVNWPEAERMAPGFLIDLFLARRDYDDDQHGIRRTRAGGWED